jgi:hypothetical protein
MMPQSQTHACLPIGGDLALALRVILSCVALWLPAAGHPRRMPLPASAARNDAPVAVRGCRAAGSWWHRWT